MKRLKKFKKFRTWIHEYLGNQLPAYFILAASLSCTFLFSFFSANYIDSMDKSDFKSKSEFVQREIRYRLDEALSTLHSVQALFNANPSITRDQFRVFHQTISSAKQLRGLTTSGYLEKVTSSELDGFIERMRREKSAEYKVWPAALKSVYFPVAYIESEAAGIQELLGFDMTSLPEREQALFSALESGEMRITELSDLLPKLKIKPMGRGLLFFTPIYSNHVLPLAHSLRFEQLKGFVFARFSAENFFKNILPDPESTHGFNVSILEEHSWGKPSLVFGQNKDYQDFLEIKISQLHAEFPLEIGGKNWIISLNSSKKTGFNPVVIIPFAIVIFGTLISILIFRIVFSERLFSLAIFESEQTYRTLAETVPGVVWMHDPKGKLEFANDYLLKLVGASSIRDKAFSPVARIHVSDRAQFKKDWRYSLKSGQPFEMQLRLIDCNNQFRWFICRSVSLKGKDGKPERWLGVAADISDQKKSESLTKLTSDASRILGESLNFELGLDSICRLMVPDFSDSFCISICGKNGQLQQFGESPHSREKVGNLSRQLKDSLEVPLISQNENIGFMHGELLTGNRTFEKPDRAFAADLASRILSTFEKEKLYRSIQNANRMKDEFLVTLSHELRTPMNVILGWVQILQMNEIAKDEQVEIFETLERNAQIQIKLITDLLDISRIISGKMSLEFNNIRISDVVKAALDVVNLSIRAKGISLDTGGVSATQLISGDFDRLQQVLWNLISNSVKYTPAGGLITISTQITENFIDLSVSDSGQGIDEKFLPFVFDRFRQQDSSMTRVHGGLGLGLSIVRYIVEQHGGTIRVSSKGTGEGSTFIVRLPFRNTSFLQAPMSSSANIPI